MLNLNLSDKAKKNLKKIKTTLLMTAVMTPLVLVMLGIGGYFEDPPEPFYGTVNEGNISVIGTESFVKKVQMLYRGMEGAPIMRHNENFYTDWYSVMTHPNLKYIVEVNRWNDIFHDAWGWFLFAEPDRIYVRDDPKDTNNFNGTIVHECVHLAQFNKPAYMKYLSLDALERIDRYQEKDFQNNYRAYYKEIPHEE